MIGQFVAGIVASETGTLINNAVLEKSAEIIKMVLNKGSNNAPWSREEAAKAAGFIASAKGNEEKIIALRLLVTGGATQHPTADLNNEPSSTEHVIPDLIRDPACRSSRT